MYIPRYSLLISLMFIALQTSFAQKKHLTEKQMLGGEKTGITTPLPQVIGWIDDAHFLIEKKHHPDSAANVFLVDCKTGKQSLSSREILQKEKYATISATTRKGDVFVTAADEKLIQLTKTIEIEINPTLSPDNKWVAFTRNNNLFTINIDNGKEYQITHDGTDLILNGYASWVYYEEILGRASKYKSFWWSPDSKHISFMRMNDSNVPLFPIYGESGLHGYSENTRYPKAGDPNPSVRIAIAPNTGGQTTWADFNENDDQYFGQPYWTPDGKTLWVQWMNRGQDSLLVYAVDLANGKKSIIYTEHQTTWINLDDEGQRIRFLHANKGFIIKSDQDGWEQLYWYSPDGMLINRITSGRNWATEIQYIDTLSNIIYYTSKEHNSTQVDLYRVGLDGKNQIRLTFGEHTHSVDLSPKGSYFITRYSNAQTPEKLTLVNNKGKIISTLGDSQGPDFNQYNLAKTELIRIPSEDGLFQLPIRITWPINFDSTKQYPVMINIYGGPNAGTVREGWQFNGLTQWWSKEGLIQVAMDHRASGHFGKNGINYLHRNLGNWELKDWITIVKWLRKNGADSTRIGIMGFSYGGYMTCMALTAGAGYFTHGLAGGSVTDWALYDTHYTERFMDMPKENSDGYQKTSIMSHVDKYKGLLRLYHGTMDDNVHLQNSLQLVRKLQDAKKHFELMVYPGGRHGWGGNQQAHSTNENNMFIYKNLLGRDIPKTMLK